LNDTPMRHVLAITAFNNAPGNFASVPDWNAFSGFTELSKFYQFFKPNSYKLDVGDSANFNGGVAVIPFNWIVENVPGSLTFNESDIHTIQGQVSVMPGGNNRGSICKWPAGQQQLSTVQSLTEPACIIVGANNATNAINLSYTVYVNCTFFRRFPFGNASLGVEVTLLRITAATIHKQALQFALEE